MSFAPGSEWVGWLIAAVMIAAVVYIIFFREDQFTRYARECRERASDNCVRDAAFNRVIEHNDMMASTDAKDAAKEVPAGLCIGTMCDFGCNSREYTDADPFVQIRQRRPSDPSDMCCTMWGHAICAGAPVGTLPSISESGGVATPEQWETWIESAEARKAGFLFLT